MTSFVAVVPARYRDPAKEYAGFGFADLLSIIRAAMVIPVVVLAITDLWTVAFWVLLAAWSTDAVDGILAKKYGSWQQKHPDLDVDGLADSAVAFVASLVPIFIVDSWSLRVLFAAFWVASVVSAVWMIMVMGKPGNNRLIIAFNMIVFHGLYQIVFVTSWFAYMAYGWWGAGMMVIATLGFSYLEREKIMCWWRGAFKPGEAPAT